MTLQELMVMVEMAAKLYSDGGSLFCCSYTCTGLYRGTSEETREEQFWREAMTLHETW